MTKIALCVEENKIKCKESGLDIKAIYQIPHFDLRKQRKNKKSYLLWETKNKIWNGWKIMSRNPTPLLEIFTLLFQGKPPPLPPLIQKFFWPPLWNFGLNLNPPFRKGARGCPLWIIQVHKIDIVNFWNKLPSSLWQMGVFVFFLKHIASVFKRHRDVFSKLSPVKIIL